MLTWWDVGRKYSLMQHFLCVLSSCLKIRHKNSCIRESTEEEIIHYDWVPPPPDFPSLDSPWMEMFIGLQTYWILLMNQTQNDKHIWYQTMWLVRRPTSLCTLIGCFMYIAIHSGWECCCYKLIDISSFLRSLIHTHFCFDFHAMRRRRKGAA